MLTTILQKFSYHQSPRQNKYLPACSSLRGSWNVEIQVYLRNRVCQIYEVRRAEARFQALYSAGSRQGVMDSA